MTSAGEIFYVSDASSAEDAVHRRRSVVYGLVCVLTVVRAHLRAGPALVPDRLERVNDALPVHVARQQIDKAGETVRIDAVVLEMHLLYPAAENAYPLLRISTEQNVADVEEGSDIPRSKYMT